MVYWPHLIIFLTSKNLQVILLACILDLLSEKLTFLVKLLSIDKHKIDNEFLTWILYQSDEIIVE